MIPYILIFSGSLWITALIHGHVWKRDGAIRYVPYKLAALVAKVILFSSIAILYYAKEYPGADLGTTGPAMVCAVVFQAAVWWLVFDLLVNLLGGRPLFHMGRTASTDAVFSTYLEKAVVQGIVLILSYIALSWADSMII